MDIDLNTTYFGFVDGEFISWIVWDDESLKIVTQTRHEVTIERGMWQRRKALLAPFKIEFTFTHGGRSYARYIRVCPEREKHANSECFYSGRNGPLNPSRRDFSGILASR